MSGILMAGLLLCAAAGGGPAPNRDKVQCKDGTWHDKGKKACLRHGGLGPAPSSDPARTSLPPTHRPHDKQAGKSPYSAFGGRRTAPRKESNVRATAICRDGTFWRSELDATACNGHGGVKEPL
ncbi:MAG: hypothetical protein E6J78_14280 [Deltaproteobacteria bacterium]|nr:MAG: hypothetical protein E6J78_14280 [Deltaproteobacteria bacterium]